MAGILDRPFVWSTGSVLLVLLLWEGAVGAGALDPVFASSPSRVLRALVDLFGQADFWADLWVSAVEFGLGFGAAVVTGLLLGLATGWYRRLRAALEPLVAGL